MGIRIHKRIKLGNGLILNVGKTGISVSAKIGDNITVNSKGKVTTKIAPGISYVHNINSKKKKGDK